MSSQPRLKAAIPFATAALLLPAGAETTLLQPARSDALVLVQSDAQQRGPRTVEPERSNWFRCTRKPQELYNDMKQTGKIAKVVVAVTALACKGFLDGPK